MITVTIERVDRSSLVARKSAINCSAQLDSELATFTLVQQEGPFYRPEIGDDVEISEGEVRVFKGTVETVNEKGYWGKPPLEIEVTANSLGVVCKRRIFGALIMGPATFPELLQAIVDGGLKDSGITLASDNVYPADSPAVTYSNLLFDYVTVYAALNTACGLVGYAWRVDHDGKLRVFSPSLGTGSAPFTLTDEEKDLFKELSVETSRENYANKVYIRNSSDTTGDQTQAQAFGVQPRVQLGMMIAAPGFHIDYPTILIDGSQYTVVPWTDISDIRAGSLYYDELGAIFNPDHTPYLIQSESGAESKSKTPLSKVVTAQDDAEITAHGLCETVVDVQDFTEQADLQACADSALEVRKEIPKTITASVKQPGAQPGQIVTVDTTYPLVDDVFLITSVVAREENKASRDDAFMWYQITASNAGLDRTKLASGWAEQNKKSGVTKRVFEQIRITLAETIEGVDNPGLTAGLKRAIATARHPGILVDASLTFEDAPATNPISVDVLQNGTSVLGSNLLTIAVGATGARQWVFVEDQQRVATGDIFTVNVTAGDAAAKDGILELTFSLFG